MSNVALQQAFADWLLQPASSPGQAMRNPDVAVDEVRLSVHRNTFLVTLIDSLAASFPVTQALAGVDFFRAMARERVLADPPRSPVLSEYATGFPRFVADFAPAAAIPYLASVARLEALRMRAFHAADAVPIGADQFQFLVHDPERLAATRVSLHPAASWLQSRFAIYDLWAAHQGVSDLAAADLAGIDPRQAQAVLLTRPVHEVIVTPTPAGAIAFLDALSAGRSLGEAFADAIDDRAPIEPALLFSMLVQRGLVIALEDSRQDSQ